MPKLLVDHGVCFRRHELIMDAYKAIKDKYRFYTYGDAMLIYLIQVQSVFTLHNLLIWR
jgi:hypothetical protein